MRMRTVIVWASGEYEVRFISADTPAGRLRQLQTIVGGDLEPIALDHTLWAVVREDVRVYDPPNIMGTRMLRNLGATGIPHQGVHGPVTFVGMRRGDLADIRQDHFDAVINAHYSAWRILGHLVS